MTYQECCEIFGIRDIINLPIAANEVLFGSAERRHSIYRQLLAANNYEVDKDWFQPIYEGELSEGKRKGQHFTPVEVYSLVSQLTGPKDGRIHEPTAGTGGLIIGDWWEKAKCRLPWEVFPSENYVVAWELSDRAVPLLLINLSIRGIMGEVYHGDVLEQKIFAKYLLINPTNDGLGFSNVIKDQNLNLNIVSA